MKWSFTQPREEFVTQLQEQMRGCVSTDLMNMLFSEDFKQQVKALDTVFEGLRPAESAPLGDAVIANFDLLLKWTTLRFFDTNPTVLIKVMQLLQVHYLYACVCVPFPVFLGSVLLFMCGRFISTAALFLSI